MFVDVVLGEVDVEEHVALVDVAPVLDGFEDAAEMVDGGEDFHGEAVAGGRGGDLDDGSQALPGVEGVDGFVDLL